MKIMLTSFGIERDTRNADPPQGFQRYFSRRPPTDMRSALTGFIPEYSLLILSDKLIFDEQSFALLTEITDNNPFKVIGSTLELLYREGFLELTDYSSVLERNSQLLTKMTENDLRSTDQWIESLYTSVETWTNFIVQILYGTPPSQLPPGMDRSHFSFFVHVGSDNYMDISVDDFRRDQELARPYIFRTLKSYLTYVNANLILSNEFGAGLHDWQDFLPFYKQKFLAVGLENPAIEAEADSSRQLFQIAFPEFAIQTPEQFLRILQNRRVGELRSLIDEAARGGVTFDEDFARSVFAEIIEVERKLGRERKLVGYLTFPVGFIPLVGNFAQLLLQEAAGTVLERKLTKKYRWFYMLSDIAYKNQSR